MQNPLVQSEVGKLQRLLIHSPDGGIGKIVPQEAQELLYEDIVDLKKMQREYDEYAMVLLAFLDPEKINKNVLAENKEAYKNNLRPAFFNPFHQNYHNSKFVIDTQKALEIVLSHKKNRLRIIAAVCAVELVLYQIDNLNKIDDPKLLTKILISGYHNGKYIFAPIPNFIFTRDIGITVGDHLLLSKTAYKARARESILAKYIGENLFPENQLVTLRESNQFSLLSKTEQLNKRITLEGGDVMMIAKGHLMVGCSERTTAQAIIQLIPKLFAIKGAHSINKVSVVKIPPKRDWMHIDTIMTQVKRNMWLIFGPLCDPLEETEKEYDFELLKPNYKKNDGDGVSILQYTKGNFEPKFFESIKELCINISVVDFGCAEKDVQFIYCGDRVFPYEDREQWTDACNVLALKEGVVIGYNRNPKTLAAFENAGFKIISSESFIEHWLAGKINTTKLTNTFITIPSSELSRARGGSHCMSMPLNRAEVTL